MLFDDEVLFRNFEDIALHLLNAAFLHSRASRDFVATHNHLMWCRVASLDFWAKGLFQASVPQ